MHPIASRRVGNQRNHAAREVSIWLVFWLLVSPAVGQTPYQPKFPGDPAHSDAEANALGYMRTVIRAQRVYQKKNQKYATSLAELVHTGSFTMRMTQTDRGDYQVHFHARRDGYELTLLPKQFDADHRAFYANEDGTLHAEEGAPATENSPVLK